MAKDGVGKLLRVRKKETLEFWRSYFDSAHYRRNLQARIERGKAPHMELYLAQRLYGKPTDRVQLEGANGQPLQVVQVYLPEKAPLALSDAAAAIEAEVVEVPPVAEDTLSASTNGHAAASAPIVLLPDNGTGGTNGHGPNGHG